MLRNNNTVADPDCVSKTVTSAKAILDIAHEFGDLGVLRHCPDVTCARLISMKMGIGS